MNTFQMYLMANRVEALLAALEAFVSDDGSILGIEDVAPLVESMENITSVESKCTFVNILLNTSKTTILNKFVATGGWKILNRWLSEVLSASENDSMFIEELLHVLLKLPVTIDLLKAEKSTPLMIKSLSKNTKYNSEVIKLSSQIVKQWTEVITAESKPKKQANSEYSHKSKSHKIKTESENSETSKIKKQHAPPSSGARKTGLEEETALNAVPTKKRPSIEMDPSKHCTELKKAKIEPQNNETQTQLQHKEIKEEPKGATKVETESEIQKEKSDQKLTNEKPLVLQPPISKTINPDPPKPKQAVLLTQDSMFADALFKPMAPVKLKVKSKVKREKHEIKSKETSKENINLTVSPTKQVSSEKVGKDGKEAEMDTDSPTETEEKLIAKVEDVAEAKEPEVKKVPRDPSLGPKPILIYIRAGKKTNRVKFKDDDNLVQVEYFEVEDGERTNFRKQQDAERYQDYAKIEMIREKMTFQKLRGFSDAPAGVEVDDSWRLASFEYPGSFDQSLLFGRGKNSTERETQNKREVSVLAELQFDRSKIPYSPKEPDREHYELKEPIVIPLGDLNPPIVEQMFQGSSNPQESPHELVVVTSPTEKLAPINTPLEPSITTPDVITIDDDCVKVPRAPQELVAPVYNQDSDLRLANKQDERQNKPPSSTSMSVNGNTEARGGPTTTQADFMPPQILLKNNIPIPVTLPGVLPRPNFALRPPFDPNTMALNRPQRQNFQQPPHPMQFAGRIQRPPMPIKSSFNPNQNRFRGGFNPNHRPRHLGPGQNQRFNQPQNQRPRHPGNQNSNRPTLDASQVCMFHAQGYCKNGDRCKLVHVPRGPPAAPQGETYKKDIDLRDFFQN